MQQLHTRRNPVIKEKNGWWYLVGIGCFYGYPFPTRADAAEALRELEQTNETLTPWS
jgi:hypothetical protein